MGKTESKDSRKWMRQAVRTATQGIRNLEGGPFGAVIVRRNKMIAMAHNTVLKTQNASCHAEINAIGIASRKLGKYDLSDCVIYSTTEPCPMCFSAIHWARIPRIVFGTAIQDVRKRGFHELSISNTSMKRYGKSRVKIRSGFMKKECLRLLRMWDKKPNKQVY